MYSHKSDIYLATNASSFENNLSVHYKEDGESIDQLAVIHEGFVNIIPVNNPEGRSKYLPICEETEFKASVKQVKWVKLNQQEYFIILSSNGMHIYDPSANNLIFHHAMKETGDHRNYSIGICVFEEKLLCIGTYLGTVWKFECSEAGFKFKNRVYAHDESVKLMESWRNFMVTSSGFMTYVWNVVRTEFDIIRKIDSPGLYAHPSTAKFIDGIIAIGFTSGELCLYDLCDEHFCLKTVAHRLQVTGIDFASNKMIVTCSNDGFMKIWKYNQTASEVENLQTIFNDEGPLYGVGFMNRSCTEICMVTGGTNKVMLFANWEATSVKIEVDPQ